MELQFDESPVLNDLMTLDLMTLDEMMTLDDSFLGRTPNQQACTDLISTTDFELFLANGETTGWFHIPHGHMHPCMLVPRLKYSSWISSRLGSAALA